MNPTPMTLIMDVPSEGGALLRLAVHRTAAGHVELANLLEIHEHCEGALLPLRATTVEEFLRSEGRIDDPNGNVRDRIHRGWMATAGDWLQMLAEELTEGDEAT